MSCRGCEQHRTDHGAAHLCTRWAQCYVQPLDTRTRLTLLGDTRSRSSCVCPYPMQLEGAAPTPSCSLPGQMAPQLYAARPKNEPVPCAMTWNCYKDCFGGSLPRCLSLPSALRIKLRASGDITSSSKGKPSVMKASSGDDPGPMMPLLSALSKLMPCTYCSSLVATSCTVSCGYLHTQHRGWSTRYCIEVKRC